MAVVRSTSLPLDDPPPVPTRVRALLDAAPAARRAAAALSTPVEGRVRSALRELAAIRSTPAFGGTRRIEVPLTQDRIAWMTGATRESVNRALRVLRRTGEVTVDARHGH